MDNQTKESKKAIFEKVLKDFPAVLENDFRDAVNSEIITKSIENGAFFNISLSSIKYVLSISLNEKYENILNLFDEKSNDFNEKNLENFLIKNIDLLRVNAHLHFPIGTKRFDDTVELNIGEQAILNGKHKKLTKENKELIQRVGSDVLSDENKIKSLLHEKYFLSIVESKLEKLGYPIGLAMNKESYIVTYNFGIDKQIKDKIKYINSWNYPNARINGNEKVAKDLAVYCLPYNDISMNIDFLKENRNSEILNFKQKFELDINKVPKGLLRIQNWLSDSNLEKQAKINKIKSIFPSVNETVINNNFEKLETFITPKVVSPKDESELQSLALNMIDEFGIYTNRQANRYFYETEYFINKIIKNKLYVFGKENQQSDKFTIDYDLVCNALNITLNLYDTEEFFKEFGVDKDEVVQLLVANTK